MSFPCYYAPTPGKNFWPQTHMSFVRFAQLLGSHSSLIRLRFTASTLAMHMELLTGHPCLDHESKVIFWCRLAGYLSETSWADNHKLVRLEDQAKQLFPQWGDLAWKLFWQSCFLVRVEHFLDLGEPNQTPWLADRVLKRLMGRLGRLELTQTHKTYLASLAGVLASEGQPGFCAWLMTQGLRWRPELLSSLIGVLRAEVLHSVSGGRPNKTLLQEVLFGIQTVTAEGLTPCPDDVVSCWVALRPDLAQRLLDAGVTMDYHQSPLIELDKIWKAVPGFKRYAPEFALDSTRKHAFSAWESWMLDRQCPTPLSSSSSTRL